MTVLLDVNVLIALAWPNHIQHAAATRWFTAREEDWATCPLTQSGFVRVSSNRKVIPSARTPREALEVMQRIISQPGHVFWKDDISIAQSRWIARERLLGHRQVTDAHLLALALRYEGLLATFDRGMPDLLPPGVQADRAVVLLSS